MRTYDPSMVTLPPNQHPQNAPVLKAAITGAEQTAPSTSGPSTTSAPPEMDPEHLADIANDPFASYFQPDVDSEGAPRDPSIPPKVLITTSPYASSASWAFCDELVGVFPGAEFFKRRKSTFRSKIPAMGTIAGWAVKRGYSSLVVVNEDHKKPSEPFVREGVVCACVRFSFT